MFIKGNVFYLTLLLINFFTTTLYAQKKASNKEQARIEKQNRINQMLRNEEEGVPAFEKHNITSIKNHHDGFGIAFEKGISKSPYKTTIFQLELGEKQHRKEQKQSTSGAINGGFAYFGRPFVFGKQNIFYQAKLGVGKQIMIGGKSNKNGVAVYGVFVGGISAGLLRPYYIQFSVDTGVAYLKYQADTKDAFLNLDPTKDIIGGSGLKKGWNEIKVNPGLYAKASLRFDWARFNHVVSAIEVGFMADFYTQKVVQMIDLPGKTFFPTGFLALNFGRRK
ncbi:MAG: hypothetical protein ACO3AA_01625 [Chitinophagaceae bacterium]